MEWANSNSISCAPRISPPNVQLMSTAAKTLREQYAPQILHASPDADKPKRAMQAGDHPSSPDDMFQVSSQVFNVQKSVKYYHEDRFMQLNKREMS